MVAHAQTLLDVCLPEDFVSLLRIQNGGSTIGFVFPTQQRTSWAEDHVPLDELYGIGPAEVSSRAQDILDTEYLTREWGLPPKQVVIAGDGHWWITLDYRAGAVPSVVFVEVEAADALQLAPTFQEFLSGLLPADQVDEESGRLK